MSYYDDNASLPSDDDIAAWKRKAEQLDALEAAAIEARKPTNPFENKDIDAELDRVREEANRTGQTTDDRLTEQVRMLLRAATAGDPRIRREDTGW